MERTSFESIRGIAAPARRGLAEAGYEVLEDLARADALEIAKIHGMGPTALASIKAALAEKGLSLR